MRLHRSTLSNFRIFSILLGLILLLLFPHPCISFLQNVPKRRSQTVPFTASHYLSNQCESSTNHCSVRLQEHLRDQNLSEEQHVEPEEEHRPTGSDRCSNAADLAMERQDNPSMAKRTDRDVGGYDPSERIGGKEINVGDPQIKVAEKERSVTSILKELAAIQQQGPQKYCILGTRHCSYLHQQIIELLYVFVRPDAAVGLDSHP